METKGKLIILLLSVVMLLCVSCGNNTQQTEPEYGEYVLDVNDDGDIVWRYEWLDETEEETEPETEPEPEYDYLVDIFADVEDWLTFSGAGSEGRVSLEIPKDYSREIHGLYLKGTNGVSNMMYLIFNNKEIGTIFYYIDKKNSISSGDIVTVSNGDITSLNKKLLENGFYIKDTEYQFSFPDRGHYISSAEELASIKDVKYQLQKCAMDSLVQEYSRLGYDDLEIFYELYMICEIKPDQVINSETQRVIVAVRIDEKESDKCYLVYMYGLRSDGEYIENDGNANFESYYDLLIGDDWDKITQQYGKKYDIYFIDKLMAK